MCPCVQFVSYGETHRRALKLACGLRSLVPSRAHVGICGRNRIEWLLGEFAAEFNDNVVVGIHHTWPQPVSAPRTAGACL
jgi:long-subunit acyl-CoA synthetase (AMP-forming)